MGWINTASPRISSIQDNLIPAERAPPLEALDVNDKELRPFPIFLSLLPDKRGNDVEKHKAVLHLISLLLLVIQPMSLQVRCKFHSSTVSSCESHSVVYSTEMDETMKNWCHSHSKLCNDVSL